VCGLRGAHNDGITRAVSGPRLLQPDSCCAGTRGPTRHGPVQIAVVANGLYRIDGEGPICPAKATVLGACKAIPQEYLNLRCRLVDVVVPPVESQWDERLIDDLIAEVAAPPSETLLAYRDSERWAQTYEPVRLSESMERGPLLREGGVYLITGGLGNICLALAAELAKSVRAKLVLVGRSALPAREDWAQWLQERDDHDRLSSRIRKVQALEALGAEVMVCSADVADEQELQQALDQATARFGGIHGVIHGAGTVAPESFFGIEQATRNGCQLHFRPKIQGLLVLDKLLRDRDLDFVLLTSSLSSILAGIGFAAYSAANAFLDAFASAHNQGIGTPWFSVDWDRWNFSESADAVVEADSVLLPHEGVETFRRILGRGTLRHVAVSVTDLQTRIDQWINFRVAGAGASAQVVPLHARPDLATEQVAPRTDAERTIARIWQDLLGIEEIGIHDNFFELGGQSLLATQLVARVRALFKTELPLRSFFEAPTVAGLAQLVEDARERNEGAQTPSIVPLSRDAHAVMVLDGGVLTPADLTKGRRAKVRRAGAQQQ